MNARPLAAVGVALTTFLVVAVAIIEALAEQIAFSVFIGLPAGVVAGVVAAAVVWLRLWDSRPARPVLLGAAAFGYAIVVAAAVSYSVPAARGVLRPTIAVPFAAGCAVAVTLLAQRYPDRID
jgi:hypothetical protein